MSEFITGSPGTTAPAAGQGEFTAAILQAVLTTRRITAMVTLAADLPQLTTFNVSLGLGEQPEHVERLAGALALAAGAASCRVSRCGGRLLLELAKPEDQRQVLRAERLDGLRAPGPMAVPIGVDTSGRVTWLDLADANSCHALFAGVTGSGKSAALRWVLYRLAKGNPAGLLRMVMIDPFASELAVFRSIPHLAHPPQSEPLEIGRLLAWCVGELGRRLAAGRCRPAVVVVVEELPHVVATVPNAGETIAHLLRVGRKAGIIILATAQHPTVKGIGGGVVNFPTRLVGRVASTGSAYTAAGRGRSGADTLLGKGDMVLLEAGSATRLQVPWLTGDLLATLPSVEQPATLDDELPAVVAAADLGRDRRGGAGRRALTDADYERIRGALEEGASVEDLRQFGIGYTRAARIASGWAGGEP